jgi:hypothetical protein
MTLPKKANTHTRVTHTHTHTHNTHAHTHTHTTKLTTPRPLLVRHILPPFAYRAPPTLTLVFNEPTQQHPRPDLPSTQLHDNDTQTNVSVADDGR